MYCNIGLLISYITSRWMYTNSVVRIIISRKYFYFYFIFCICVWLSLLLLCILQLSIDADGIQFKLKLKMHMDVHTCMYMNRVFYCLFRTKAYDLANGMRRAPLNLYFLFYILKYLMASKNAINFNRTKKEKKRRNSNKNSIIKHWNKTNVMQE